MMNAEDYIKLINEMLYKISDIESIKKIFDYVYMIFRHFI